MKKIISSCLSVAMITTMCATTIIPATAANDNKATVNVYDFVGGVYNKGATTQPQLDGKAVSRGTYQFEVGDLVNVKTTYSSDTISVISGYLGHTFINQVSVDPKSESSFLVNTNSLNSTLQFDDGYFGDGVFCESSISDALFMSIPEVVYTDKTNPNYNENDLKLDRLSYNGINGSKKGIKLNNGKAVLSFTVLVTDNTECNLYTALQEVVDNSEIIKNVTTEIETTTSLEKVGHIETPNNDLELSSFTVSSKTITLGETVTLKAEVNGGKGDYTYLLKGNSNRIATTTTSEKTFTKSWKPSKTGTYTLDAVVTDATGKSVSKTITLNVEPASTFDMTSFTVSSTTITLGETVTLKAEVNGGKGDYTYLLKGNGNRIATTTTSEKTFTKSWKPSKTGMYRLDAVVTDATGKSVSKTITLNVEPASTFDMTSFTVSSKTITLGETVTLKVEVNGGKADYTYLLKGNGNRIATTTTSEKTFTKSWKPSKTGTYTLDAVVTDATGKSVSKTITLNVEPASTLTITSFTVSPTTIKQGETVILKVQVNGGKADYTYLIKGNGNRITNTTTSEKTFTKSWKPSKTGTYTLETVVTDATGKSVSKTIQLIVK